MAICNSNMITEDMYEVEIPICIEKNWNVYQYKSFTRGYHAYMNIWSPLVGEILQCRHEQSNEVDENAIAIIRTDSLRKESIVGHVPQNISKLCILFLKVPNTYYGGPWLPQFELLAFAIVFLKFFHLLFLFNSNFFSFIFLSYVFNLSFLLFVFYFVVIFIFLIFFYFVFNFCYFNNKFFLLLK